MKSGTSSKCEFLLSNHDWEAQKRATAHKKEPIPVADWNDIDCPVSECRVGDTRWIKQVSTDAEELTSFDGGLEVDHGAFCEA